MRTISLVLRMGMAGPGPPGRRSPGHCGTVHVCLSLWREQAAYWEGRRPAPDLCGHHDQSVGGCSQVRVRRIPRSVWEVLHSPKGPFRANSTLA